jgi:hypothetical protein
LRTLALERAERGLARHSDALHATPDATAPTAVATLGPHRSTTRP